MAGTLEGSEKDKPLLARPRHVLGNVLTIECYRGYLLMPNIHEINFGNKLKKIIAAKSISREQLAHDIGVSLKTVNRWINEGHKPRTERIKALKNVLELSDQDIREWLGLNSSELLRTSGDYSVCSFITAKGRLGSFEALAEELENIESNFPVPMQENEYGTSEQWLEILKIAPDSGGVLLHKDNEFVGHWQCLPVKEYIYHKFISGENVNQNISCNDVFIITDPGHYKMIFVSLFVLEDHRNYHSQRLMRMDFLDFLRESAENGIFFDSIICNITGLQALNLCESFGLKFKIKHPVHRFPTGSSKIEAEIHELKLPSGGERLFSLDRHLGKLYNEFFIGLNSN